MNFIIALENAFAANKNPENAFAMSKYMKNNFPFFGIKTDERRRIFSAIWKENKIEVSANARAIAETLYSKQEREFHYCAIEILIKELKGNYTKKDIEFIEKLIITNSWWDSVDTISKYLLGRYLVQFPEQTNKVIEKFSKSSNIWLNRSILLFQLDYKKNTNFTILEAVCEHFKESNEFFIQKAMGWALREYSKTNPIAVQNYVLSTNLKPLSKKEALRIIEKQKL